MKVVEVTWTNLDQCFSQRRGANGGSLLQLNREKKNAALGWPLGARDALIHTSNANSTNKMGTTRSCALYVYAMFNSQNINPTERKGKTKVRTLTTTVSPHLENGVGNSVANKKHLVARTHSKKANREPYSSSTYSSGTIGCCSAPPSRKESA